MEKLKLIFSTDFDVVFDYRGITDVPGGTSPHHPDQPRVVIRNSQTQFRTTQIEDDACEAAVEVGQQALDTWVRSNCVGVDERAARSLASFS